MYLACLRIGAVVNPLMHIFRERELSSLRNGEAKVMIAPKTFRGFDFRGHARFALQPSLPDPAPGGRGQQRRHQLDALLSGPGMEAEHARRTSSRAAALARGRRDPAYPQHLGHHGEPSWAMHLANTLFFQHRPLTPSACAHADDTILMVRPWRIRPASCNGLMMPIVLAASACCGDVEPKKRRGAGSRPSVCHLHQASTPS